MSILEAPSPPEICPKCRETSFTEVAEDMFECDNCNHIVDLQEDAKK